MIKEAIEKLMQAENLTYDQVKESVDEIMTGQASPALIASFLTALSIKGETDEEIAGAAESMRSKALPLDSDGDILDIVGTGGDKSGTDGRRRKTGDKTTFQYKGGNRKVWVTIGNDDFISSLFPRRRSRDWTGIKRNPEYGDSKFKVCPQCSCEFKKSVY